MDNIVLSQFGNKYENADIVATLTANKVIIEGSVGGVNISTEEHKVGTFFGVDLFEKTFIINGPSKGGWVEVAHNLNIAECEAINGIAHVKASTGAWFYAGMYGMSNSTFEDRLCLEVYNDHFGYYVGRSNTCDKIYVTLRYTKAQ